MVPVFRHLLRITLFILITHGWVFSQSPQQALPEKTRILFLLDGSGSMLAKWGDDLRIRQAKSILSDLVDSLRVNTNLELALRAYGHQFDRRLQNCTDSRLEYPFRPNNHDAIIESLKDIRPKGTTPIAYSLEQAANDFPSEDQIRNIVIIITDGIESCDGDPCAVSLALQKKGIFLKPFVIGLGMRTDYTNQFDCVGQYFDARETNDFRKVLNKALKQSLDKTTVSVELLDIEGRPRETDVNVTFYNNFTDQPTYEFVHYRDHRGKPDSVEVDAVLTYDIVVNTIPQVIKKNIQLNGGEHNVIPIKTPQGTLQIRQPNHTEYADPVKAIIRKASKSKTLTIQKINEKQKLLVGQYDLEIFTLPRTYLSNVKIEQSKTKLIELPAPGLFTILSNTEGIGSIYTLKESSREIWTSNLPDNQNQITFAMQPGKYKLVFRAKKARGSKFTQVREFTIRSNSTTKVNMLSN